MFNKSTIKIEKIISLISKVPTRTNLQSINVFLVPNSYSAPSTGNCVYRHEKTHCKFNAFPILSRI